MTWRVIELTKKPAGYADHKPPYDFKHGWIPLTSVARSAKAKAKAKSDPGSSGGPGSKLSESQQRAFENSQTGGAPLDLPTSVNQQIAREWSESVRVKGEFTTDEEDAIQTYQWGEPEVGWGSTIYEKLNEYKRAGRGQMDDDELDELDFVHEGMLTAIFKSRTTRDLTVFRGVRDGQPPIRVGDVITDKAWVSTSYEPHIAHEFSSHGKDKTKNRVMVISVPKGTPALKALSDEELELILGPDTAMRVVREDGQYLYLELI